jgi:membrane peptidoglycan carboxypeptidase
MRSHPGFSTPISPRRLLAVIAVLMFVVAPSAATLWVATPDASDVQDRVVSYADSLGVRVLEPAQIPDLFAKAVVATEDHRFYLHHGIDTIGLGRAVLYDLTNRCLCQGGSTITEQLVKEVYLDGSDRGYNKLADVMLALKVETVLSKDQILADYLSVIATGQNRYGVNAAACAYFHLPLDRLTLAQYALLAGVPQAPSIYDPTVNPNAALNRRAGVLVDMVSQGYITQAQAIQAQGEPVVVDDPKMNGCLAI